MRFSLSLFLVAALAGSTVTSLAFPAAYGNTVAAVPSGSTSSSSSSSKEYTVAPPSGTGNPLPPTDTGKPGPYPPTGTGNPPPHPPVTEEPPTTITKYGPIPTTKTIYDTSVYTTTVATFCPHSTIVGTSAGTTYYSTYLSVSYYTTCPTITKTHYEVVQPTAYATTTAGAGTGTCPPLTTVYSTIISYVTLPSGGDVPPAETVKPACHICQTITKTLPNGGVTTVTVTPTGSASSVPPYPTPTGSGVSPPPAGTGSVSWTWPTASGYA